MSHGTYGDSLVYGFRRGHYKTDSELADAIDGGIRDERKTLLAEFKKLAAEWRGIGGLSNIARARELEETIRKLEDVTVNPTRQENT